MDSKQLAEHIISVLESIRATDAACLEQMFEQRVPCTDAIVAHPTAVPTLEGAGYDSTPCLRLGPLGLLNALIPDHLVVAIYEGSKLLGFECKKRT